MENFSNLPKVTQLLSDRGQVLVIIPLCSLHGDFSPIRESSRNVKESYFFKKTQLKEEKEAERLTDMERLTFTGHTLYTKPWTWYVFSG